jgi:heat shock protein HslJ
MHSRILLGLAAVTIAIALGGCATASGGDSGSSGASPQSILGTWQLVGGTDANGAISPDGAPVTVKLNGAHSGGQGPCNSFGATETGSTTGKVSIRLGIRTMIACAEDTRNVTESNYFAALGKVTTASIASDKLTLAGGGVRLVFTKSTK